MDKISKSLNHRGIYEKTIKRVKLNQLLLKMSHSIADTRPQRIK